MYPDNLIRGISDPKHVGEDWVSASVFYFGKMLEAKKSKTPSVREDGWWEESINWLDDENSLNHLLSQKKENGKIQFKAGAVVLNRKMIDLVRKQALLSEMYSYERDEIDGNPYHGNLTCHPKVPIDKMKQMAGSIALMCIDDVIGNSN